MNLSTDNRKTNTITRLEKEYSIIRYKQSLFPKVMKMFNESAGKGFEKPEHYFRYNLSQSPYGKPIRFLMEWRGSIVGSHSTRPFFLKIKKPL